MEHTEQSVTSSDVDSLKSRLENERMNLADLESEYFELQHACDLQIDMPFTMAEAESRLLSLATQIEQQRTLVEDLEFSLMEAELKVSECTPFDLTDSLSDSVSPVRQDDTKVDKTLNPADNRTAPNTDKILALSNFDTHLLDFDSKLTSFNSKLIEFDSKLASLSTPLTNTTVVANGHVPLNSVKSSNGDSQLSLTPRTNSTLTVNCVPPGSTALISVPNGNTPSSITQNGVSDAAPPNDAVSAGSNKLTCLAQPVNNRCSTPNSISDEIKKNSTANLNANTNVLPMPTAVANNRSLNASLSNSLDLLDDVFESRLSLANNKSRSISNSNSASNRIKTDNLKQASPNQSDPMWNVPDSLARLHIANGLFSDTSNSSFQASYSDGRNLNFSMNRSWPSRNGGSVGILNLKQYLTETCGHDVAAVREQVQVETTRVTGYMHKMGGRIKTWKRRWFSFDIGRRTLSYFVAADQRALKGAVQFEALEDVYCDHVRACPRRSPNSRLTFCVRTPQRTYFFVAPSLEAMRIWIDVILTACPSFSRSLAATAAPFHVPVQ